MKSHEKTHIVAAALMVVLSVISSCGGTQKEVCGETGKSCCPKMVYVEGGQFSMGDVLGDGDRAMLAELPVHKVRLGSFLIAPYEVTVAEFGKFAAETGYKTRAEVDNEKEARKDTSGEAKKRPSWRSHDFEQTGRDPVVWIAWEDAICYCNWLSKKHNLPVVYNETTGELLDKNGKATTNLREVVGFRLPSEAEWEYAARDRGKNVRFGNGKMVAKSTEMNFNARKAEKKYAEKGQYRAKTTPVGSFAPNKLGLYDMSGNAWEWCTDSGVDYTEGDLENPYALHEGGHMARGGTWDSEAPNCRVTTRINWWPGARCAATGFRLARTAP